MKKKTIVVDARMINSSGIGTYLKNILPYIKEYFNLILLGDVLELNKFKWTANCKKITFNSNIYSIDEQLKYLSIVPKTKLLWCPHFNVPIFPVKAKSIVTTIHDVNHLNLKHNYSFFEHMYAKKLYNNAVKKSKKIITVSDFSKSELLKHTSIKTEKIERIYCGIDEGFCSSETNLSISIPKKFILFVGNVKPHKNIITLLKAYNKLPKKEFKLVILGRKDGFITKENTIFNYIKTNNISEKVFFTGFLTDKEVVEVYKRASLFVFPSLYEGFGLPLLEAMSCSVPVISSSKASLKEVGGNACMYFDGRDYNDLSLKIDTILKDKNLSQEYINKGLQRVKCFSWQKAAENHIKIFEQYL